jgi:hypothetical protein
MSSEEAKEHYIEKRETAALSDGLTTVELRKIFTPAGERLELEAPNVGRSIRLDAMELESLSWQEPETFIGFLAQELPGLPEDTEARAEFIREAAAEENGDADVKKAVTVTNEFAEAAVRALETDAGDRLEIEAPKLGYRTRLTPTGLETVTWQTTETFTEFLEKPFGPDDH